MKPVFKKAGWVLLRLVASYGPLVVMAIPSGHAATTIEQLTGDLASIVGAMGGLMAAVSGTLFATGLLARFLPWASQRTKDFGGVLLDHGILLAALGAVGLFILFFAGQIAVGITGKGEAFEPGGPWQVPTG